MAQHNNYGSQPQYQQNPQSQQQYHAGYGQQQPQYQQPPQPYGQMHDGYGQMQQQQQPFAQQPPQQYQQYQQPPQQYQQQQQQQQPPQQYQQPLQQYQQKPGQAQPPVHQANVAQQQHKLMPDAVAGIPLYEEDLGPDGNAKFVKRGYQDAWAIPVFIVVMVATFLGGIFYDSTADPSKATNQVSDEAGKYLPAAAASSVALALTSLAVMKCAPVGYIYFANILAICLIAALGIILLAVGSYIMGALFLLGAAFSAFVFYRLRDRIPFAALLLKTSVDLATRFWGSFITGLVTLVVLMGFFAAWALACIPVMGALEGSNGSSVGSYFVLFVLVFVLFWGIQVGANVVHVTASGVVATWYFVGENRMPTTAVPANLKRSLTTSFGSICFGSAVVALLKTIYYFLRRAIDAIDQPIVECILGCILGIIESLTELFNIYAFTQVAIYGHDFITAAKQTFALVKESGWALVFNDSLVWPVLSLTNFFGSLLIFVIFWVVAGPGVGAMAFMLASAIFTIFFRPVYSGIATQFVCVAENPDAMAVANPDYAREMNEKCPPDVRAGNRDANHHQQAYHQQA